MSDSTKLDDPLRGKQVAFLEAYAVVGTLTHAAEVAQVDRTSHNYWLAHDDLDLTYTQAFDLAQQAFNDQIRKEVRRRAIEGWHEPVWFQGKEVGTVLKFSDRLLELLATAKCKEFRTRREITGPEGGPIKLEQLIGGSYDEPKA